MVDSPDQLAEPLLQDTAGLGGRGASLILSTAAAGIAGALQDWLTIDSNGLTTLAG